MSKCTYDCNKLVKFLYNNEIVMTVWVYFDSEHFFYLYSYVIYGSENANFFTTRKIIKYWKIFDMLSDLEGEWVFGMTHISLYVILFLLYKYCTRIQRNVNKLFIVHLLFPFTSFFWRQVRPSCYYCYVLGLLDSTLIICKSSKYCAPFPNYNLSRLLSSFLSQL